MLLINELSEFQRIPIRRYFNDSVWRYRLKKENDYNTMTLTDYGQQKRKNSVTFTRD